MATRRGFYKYVAAEHILIIFMLAYSPIIPTQTQYIEKRVGEQLGATNYTMTTCSVNKSSPEYQLREKVQAESSIWSLYLNVTIALVVLFSANVWGALSDKYGRYVALILPCIGLLVNSVVNILVVYFNLPLYVLLFGSLVQGISGDITTFIVGVAGYNSDVTIPESRERMIHFFMIDVTYCLSESLCQFALGFIIRNLGFVVPYLTIIGLIAICGIFIMFFLPAPPSPLTLSINVDASGNETPSNPLNIFKNIYHLFHQGRRRAWLLAGYNLIIFLGILIGVAWVTLSVLYTTGQPFCMDPVYEGYYQGAMFGVYTIGTIIGGAILSSFFSKFWAMHVATLLLILSQILTAIAKDYLLLYLGLAAGLFMYVWTPLSRSSMANLVGPHEQGVVFAFNGCLMSLSSLLSPIIFNAIYSATLHFMAGFVFLTIAFVVVVCGIVIVLLHIFEPKQRSGYEVIVGQDSAGPKRDEHA